MDRRENVECRSCFKTVMMNIKIPLFCLLTFFCLSFLSAQETPPTDSLLRLNLLFVGDVMGHGPQIKSAEVIKNEYYDYLPCFQYVRPLIEQADLAIGNLEVTLPGKPPYKGYPSFRSPDDLAYALRISGFDLMVTSNNHSNDAGKLGVINTISTLKDYGFYQTGTFKNQGDKDLFYPLVVYKNGFKLAFLNYTYDTNGVETRPPTIVNLIDTTQMKADMALARQFNADAIIVLMHWGLEYQLTESKKQQKLAEKLFDWGADLVIGSHPHVVQPIKTDSVLRADSSFKEVLVTYSLGNFISNQTKANTDGGIIFEAELVKDSKTGKTSLGEHHYIPVWRYIHKPEKGKSSYYTIPVSAFENEESNPLSMPVEDQKAMKKFVDKTRKHLNKYSSPERYLSLEDLNIYPEIAKKTELTSPENVGKE